MSDPTWVSLLPPSWPSPWPSRPGRSTSPWPEGSGWGTPFWKVGTPCVGWLGPSTARWRSSPIPGTPRSFSSPWSSGRSSPRWNRPEESEVSFGYLEIQAMGDSARNAQLLAWMLGVIIFIESNITVLVAGSVARPLFDRFKTLPGEAGVHHRLHLRPHLYPDSPECLGCLQPGDSVVLGCRETRSVSSLGRGLQLLRHGARCSLLWPTLSGVWTSAP